MVREQGDWIFYVLAAMLLAGMAMALFVGPAKSNHSYVSPRATSRGQ